MTEEKRLEEISEFDASIKKLIPAIADAGLANFIETLWKTAQAKFDALIAKTYGNIGLKLKQALDAIFRSIFFKIAGSVLYTFIDKMGIKKLLMKIFHDILSLEENRQRIVDLLIKVPEGGPVSSHPVLQ